MIIPFPDPMSHDHKRVETKSCIDYNLIKKKQLNTWWMRYLFKCPKYCHVCHDSPQRLTFLLEFEITDGNHRLSLVSINKKTTSWSSMSCSNLLMSSLMRCSSKTKSKWLGKITNQILIKRTYCYAMPLVEKLFSLTYAEMAIS